jgi:hypothetical protein
MGRAFPSQDIQQAGNQLRFRKARTALFSANRYEVAAILHRHWLVM